MRRSIPFQVLLLCLLLVATAPAAPLDDYYLARFGKGGGAVKVRALSAASGAASADRCRTDLYRSLKRDWKALERTTQKTLAQYIGIPALQDEMTCTPVGGHFTFHYATSGMDAPDLTDANLNGVPDWVEKVAGVFEYVYDVEVAKMGYPPPPGSTYHVYLKDLVSDSMYGVTQDNGAPAYPAYSASTFIEIDKAFTDAIFTVHGRFTPEQMLRVTAAHEFHHAIQFGMNYYFDSWYAEVTSTWMEDEVYDSVNQLYTYLDSYVPSTRTIAVNAPLGGNSEYGRWIFNRYLAELQGSRTVIRSFWEVLAAKGAPSNRADYPMLPVIETVLQNNTGNNFFGFAKRMLLSDWGSAHLSDINLIPSLTPWNTASVSGSVTPVLPDLSTPYTFTTLAYTPSDIGGGALVIQLPGLSAQLAVAAYKHDDLGWHGGYQYDPVAGGITVPAFTTDAVAYLVACNNGGDMREPVVVTPGFSADGSTVTDGSAFDANRLVIPAAQAAPKSSSSGGGGCFIATAAYGSYLHPKVAELRAFRDRHLLTNAPGRLFVSLYYKVSPPIAKVVAGHEWMKSVVRVMLLPLIFGVEHPEGALLVLLLTAVATGRGLRLQRVRSAAAWR